MKKKNIKPLILSSLAALSMGTVSVAGTFALFTDKAETSVQIGSGEIKVNAALDGIALYSADASLTSGDLAGVITGDYAGTYYYKQQTGSFYNGGTASITGTTLSVQRMSPGDKVVTNLGFTNDSNIAIKYRLRVNTSNVHGDELLKNLELKIMGNKYHGLKELQTKWTQIDADASITGSQIELVLPLETGNEAQAKDANFTFTLEAVQANANVVDLEKAVSYPKEEKLTDAEMASDVVATAKEIEVPMTAEVNETKTVKVVVPAGANLEEDASSLSLYVENMGEDPTYQGISIQVDQGAEIYEVTLDGIDEANTEPITVTVNLGYQPLAIYHVHGQPPYDPIPFTYNSTTGLTTFTTTNFSEFTFVRDTNIIEIPNLAKLNLVREAVNGGNTLAGKTIKLLTDLDLKNVEWTPIGNNDHPFSGNFDGCGHKISNLKISNKGSYNGIFGKVVGVTEGATYKTVASEVWDAENYNLIPGTYSEDLYKTVIKNFTIEGFDVNTAEYGAAAIGWAQNCYIKNIKVYDGIVTDEGAADRGKIAGVVGVSGANVIYDGLETGADVDVIGRKHSIAGIVSNIQRGDNGNAHFVLLMNCINRADVTWVANGGTTGGLPIAGVVANAGSATGLTSVIYNCHNQGNIVAEVDCNYACGIVGQAGVWVKGIYGCSNSGNITASAHTFGVAGICITEAIPAIACTNSGILTNTADANKVYDISSSTSQLTIANEVFADVAALQTRLANAVGTAKSVILKNITVTDTTGALAIPNGPSYISANSKVCDSIVIPSSLVNINMMGLNQTLENVTKTLVFTGSNNVITVAENSVNGSFAVGGDNNTFINNGTMDGVTCTGNGNIIVRNNGTMRSLSMIATTANVTLENYGTIYREGIYAIHLECDGTLTLKNYGTIAVSGQCALLFYNDCTVNMYAYEGSVVTGGLWAYRGTHTVNIFYQAGTTINGQSWTSVASVQYNVNVAEMN